MLLALMSCQKIIHVDLRQSESLLVIDADMSDVHGLNVQLSKSVNFYDENDFPPVNNAIVVLQNLKTNRIDTLKFEKDGLYYLRRKPTVGTSYKLFVTVDTTTYTAISTMPEVTVPDSITFVKKYSFGDNIITTKVNFQDKAGVDNYYLFKQYILKSDKVSFYPFSDRLSDGRYIQYDLRNDSAYIQEGDSIAINMQCIDKNVYTYFSVLENISADETGFGSASPANPPTNIVGKALGIFNVHSDYTKTLRVPNKVPVE